MENVIDKETALKEFDRWATEMRLDRDFSGLDENDKVDSISSRIKIIESIMSGVAVVTDDGLLHFTPSGRDPITFNKPTGSAFVAMDRKKSTSDFGKMFAFLADITKTAPAVFSNMDLPDVKFCMSVMTLFLV